MLINRAYRYRLAPSPEQEKQLRQFAAVCRFVYNIAFEQRRDWWRQYHKVTGRHLGFAAQSAQVTQLRSEADWICAVPADCLHAAVKDLDRSFENFSKRKTGYPKPRKKGEDETFRFLGKDMKRRSLNSKWAAVRLPKIGWVKFRSTRPICGIIKNGTVSLDATGWHIAFACEIEHETPAPSPEVVGIDRGVATTLALSTGEMLTMPVSLKQIEDQKRRAQRVVARRKRGSSRRRRAQRRVARLQARQARVRRNFHHRAALDIAKRFGVAVLEDLKTRNMTASARGTVAEPGRNVRQKAGLNRAILNAGWHQFATILTYKMEERGGQVVTVPAQFTSQTCAACGVVDARSRKSQAVFACVACGHADHADINAAKEILRRGSTPLLRVEEPRQGPVEARTIAVREHGLNLALTG